MFIERLTAVKKNLVLNLTLLKVLAFSLVTNQCNIDVANLTSAAPCAEEVLDVAATKEKDMKNFVTAILRRLSVHL